MTPDERLARARRLPCRKCGVSASAPCDLPERMVHTHRFADAAARLIGIVGSREWSDDIAVRNFVYKLPRDVVVVTGCAKDGVDAEVRAACEIDSRQPLVFKAKWREQGRAAGPIRNGEIAAVVDELHAFAEWCRDERCKGSEPHYTHGTRDVTTKARRAGKFVSVREAIRAL